MAHYPTPVNDEASIISFQSWEEKVESKNVNDVRKMPCRQRHHSERVAVMSHNLLFLSKKMKPDELRSPGDEICLSPFKWVRRGDGTRKGPSLRQLSKSYFSFLCSLQDAARDYLHAAVCCRERQHQRLRGCERQGRGSYFVSGT